MKQEISAGIVVYRKTPEGPKFLILYHGHSYWNFPKGHIESEEKSFAAAIRETREETGLTARDLKLAQNFKAYERFYFKRNGQQIYKIVIFYLAETRNPIIKVSHEHQGYAWMLFKEAQGILGKYRDSQKVLRQAYDFLKRNSRRPAMRSGFPPRASHEPQSEKKRPPLPLAYSPSSEVELLRRTGAEAAASAAKAGRPTRSSAGQVSPQS